MTPFDHLVFSALSDVGRRRKNNEDACAAVPRRGFWCVSDGMGGGDDGEIASSATVRAALDLAKSEIPPEGTDYPIEWRAEGVERAVSDASDWIFRRARERHLKGCGATFVGVLFDPTVPSRPLALHAGDSRLYCISEDRVLQVTKDHSASEMIGVHDESDVNPMFRGIILRAVGIQRDVELERTAFEVHEGDRVLLCSDGLSRMVADCKIAEISRANPNPDDAVRALVSAANAAGGIDNITVLMIDIGHLPDPIPQTVPAVRPPRVSSSEAEDGVSTENSAESWAEGACSEKTMTFDSMSVTTLATVSMKDGDTPPSMPLPEVSSESSVSYDVTPMRRNVVGRFWVCLLLIVVALVGLAILFLALKERNASAVKAENERLKSEIVRQKDEFDKLTRKRNELSKVSKTPDGGKQSGMAVATRPFDMGSQGEDR